MPWTQVPKPTEQTTSTGSADAAPFGLLLAITSVISVGSASSVITGWSRVSKPTSSVWTVVPKPTSSTWTRVNKPID